MTKTVTNTEIKPQGGKLHALAHWVEGEKQGIDRKVFEDFHEAQVWLNDQKTASNSNDQAKSVHAAASHNLSLVIDQLESIHHSALKDVLSSLKSAQDALKNVEL